MNRRPAYFNEVYCPYIGREVSGVTVHQCVHSNVETYICSYTGCSCIAAEGMALFDKALRETATNSPSQPKCTGSASFSRTRAPQSQIPGFPGNRLGPGIIS